MQRVKSDLSFVGLMKLVEDVVGVVMEFSNENATLEDNIATLEGDITTFEDKTASNEGNEDLFLVGAEKFSFQTIITKESTCADDHLYKGRIFSSKVELKRALNMLALKEHFGIRVKRSCTGHYKVGCKDKACKFSVRATKLPEGGEYWQVRTFHKVHTCTVDGLQGRFATASVKIIGELMSHKVQANEVALRPKDIIGEMRVQWGFECLYELHHSLCGYHLKKNFKNKFKRDDVSMIFTLARDYYKVSGFNRHMNQLKQIHARAHTDLMRIGPKRWARACSLARRYQMMTSNIAECVNSCLKHARQMLITILIKFIRDKF
ncbi:Uncharacterized protein TCM_043370 [Theobroma cacao]|uniref:Transposase MuDR plant domain-containing protein n=1 Tax=Theobroma cacao TaxID=3641 RepID=A0A061FPN9_THECC|nr:Uncharacterized protein TCM_043370 [Theobroma cacao]